MRQLLLIAGLVAVVASSVPAAEPAAGQDEQAIRAVVAAFTKAYNVHDADAVAALFTPDGEVVSEEGEAFRGHDAIQQVFAEVFQEHPQARIEVAVASIRLVAPGVAIEDGTSTVTYAPGEPAKRNRYTVVHVKQVGRWLMASARDLPDEVSSADEQLPQLAWLIGDWVDESPDALIKTSYRWTDNRCFILGEFTVQIEGRPAMTGSQRIGWDPVAKKIRSWVFDSEGGFGQGLWTRDGNQWIVKMTSVTREGQTASATNVTTRITNERMTWESRDRMVGEEREPDVGPVLVVRRPPPPKPEATQKQSQPN